VIPEPSAPIEAAATGKAAEPTEGGETSVTPTTRSNDDDFFVGGGDKSR